MSRGGVQPYSIAVVLLLAATVPTSLSGCTDSKSAEADGVEGEAGEGVRFTDVTEEAGLGAFRHFNGGFGQKWMPEIVGAGGGFIDFDGDGWQDILLVGGGAFPGRPEDDVPAFWLYRNNGGGTFTPANEEAGLSDVRAYGFGIAVADYDNDGDPDFLLTTLHENLLFRNDGGVFTEVGREAGIADAALWSTSALFFDADRDGHLDLYVANYVDWTPETDILCQFEGEKGYCTPQGYKGVSGSYYRNDGDGTFTNRTREAGFLAGIEPERNKALGVAEMDYNSDGWTDLMVANDTERNLLFENDGDGTFTERGVRSGVAFDQHGKARAGMGIDAGVVDSSGAVTAVVGNFSEEMVGVFRHSGDGLFMPRDALSRIGHSSLKMLTFGLFLFDADLDTDLDLLIANGHVQEHVEKLVEGVTFRQRPQLFLNRGDGVFDEHRPETGPFAERLVGRGAAYADYDRDGDLDVLITENGGPAHLWRNDLSGGHFLRVRLEGRESNRDGIGSRIRAWVGGLMMERRVRTGSSYLSQSETVAAFGLGQAREVDTLEVVWPSGRVERFEEVEGDREVLLLEGAGVLTTVPLPGREALASVQREQASR